jgi:hypothetical protein
VVERESVDISHCVGVGGRCGCSDRMEEKKWQAAEPNPVLTSAVVCTQ